MLNHHDCVQFMICKLEVLTIEFAALYLYLDYFAEFSYLKSHRSFEVMVSLSLRMENSTARCSTLFHVGVSAIKRGFEASCVLVH